MTAEPLSEQQLAEIREGALTLPKARPGYTYVARSWEERHLLAEAERLEGSRTALLAEIERLTAELAKYVGEEPTLAEEELYVHEQQLRARIAQDVNRARRPEFPAGERPDLIVATTRAIDIQLIEDGPAAPYWVPEGGERS